jgi:hypothetical protein
MCNIEEGWKCTGGSPTTASICGRCGDGCVQGNEECDDGANNDKVGQFKDGCSKECKIQIDHICTRNTTDSRGRGRNDTEVDTEDETLDEGLVAAETIPAHPVTITSFVASAGTLCGDLGACDGKLPPACSGKGHAPLSALVFGKVEWTGQHAHQNSAKGYNVGDSVLSAKGGCAQIESEHCVHYHGLPLEDRAWVRNEDMARLGIAVGDIVSLAKGGCHSLKNAKVRGGVMHLEEQRIAQMCHGSICSPMYTRAEMRTREIKRGTEACQKESKAFTITNLVTGEGKCVRRAGSIVFPASRYKARLRQRFQKEKTKLKTFIDQLEVDKIELEDAKSLATPETIKLLEKRVKERKAAITPQRKVVSRIMKKLSIADADGIYGYKSEKESAAAKNADEKLKSVIALASNISLPISIANASNLSAFEAAWVPVEAGPDIAGMVVVAQQQAAAATAKAEQAKVELEVAKSGSTVLKSSSKVKTRVKRDGSPLAHPTAAVSSSVIMVTERTSIVDSTASSNSTLGQAREGGEGIKLNEWLMPEPYARMPERSSKPRILRSVSSMS